MNTDENSKESTKQALIIPVVSNSNDWWNSLDIWECQEYFDMYYRDMEKMDLIRTCSVDELDNSDIEQIYNDYYC